MLAIIGGSGLTRLSTLAVAHREVVRTPYGDPSSTLLFGQIAGRDAVFLARHGHGHTIPPHRVNYRANAWALQQKGATSIVAVASVGGIRDCRPARSRAAAPAHRLHIRSRNDVFRRRRPQVSSTPISRVRIRPELRERCLAAARDAGIALTDGGVYGAVNGPRLETAAEIDRLDRDGATLVGMTGMPEAALAREAGLPYVADLRRRQPRGGTRGQRARGVDGRDRERARNRDGQGPHAARSHRAPHMKPAALCSSPRHARAIMIRDILRMGDPRLLERAKEVEVSPRPSLRRCSTTCATRWPRTMAPDLPRRRSACRCASSSSASSTTRAIPTPSRCPTPSSSIRCSRRSATNRKRAGKGCLSVPGFRGVVPRYTRLRYEGFDPRGRRIARDVEGFHARVVQHECDHLDGILYPMRIVDMRKFGFTDVLFPEMAGADE